MIHNNPIVSVCVITYNQENFIGETLDGILMQKCDFPFEIVIGEDHSTDSTRNICEDYAMKYPDTIRLLPSERNYGMNPNFIRTLRACSGEFIAVCEGDDYWTDELKLQKQADILRQNSNYSACITNAKLINENKEFIRLYLNGQEEGCVSRRKLIMRGGASYPTASILFRNNKDIFNVMGDIKELAGDNILILVLAMLGDVYYLDEITCVYRIWQGGVYTKKSKNIKDAILRKKNTVKGLKKFLKIVPRDYRKYVKERISVESLFVIEYDGVMKNLGLIANLTLKDNLRLVLGLLKINDKVKQ